METELKAPENGGDGIARYFLRIGDERLGLNKYLDHEIQLLYRNEIRCIHCGRLTKKSYGQGYCYPCFISLPETDACIIRPELCQAHLGISRDMAWSEEHCLQDHYVYLALSGGLKVGVTRRSQVPTRWIDQGARQAIILAKTPNRHLAGEIEVALKAHLSDKTNWRLMLTREAPEEIDLIAVKHNIRDKIPEDMQGYYFDDDRLTNIRYPVKRYPEKVKSLNFDKNPAVGGKLTGIKGQYLIFFDGSVFNIRRHSGYLTEITIK
ncbi:MAG: DUF2797 domain-containing protein [Chlorobi bacterium]|nr:DUF2797 domain-containing protein [Chlorobiota bacterium]